MQRQWPDGGKGTMQDKPAQRASPVRELEPAEIAEIVERNFWGVLATAGADAQPYAVPIIFGYDGAFYAVLRPGRKLDNLRANPSACLTIAEVTADAKMWRSVVAHGDVDILEDDAEVDGALDVIRAQYPGEPTRQSQGAASLAAGGFHVMRLRPTALTGRAQG